MMKEEENDLNIKTDIGDFIFTPTFIIKDKSEKSLLYLKFIRKEKLVLYLTNKHPESNITAEKLKKEFIIITKGYGEDWIVTDVVEYIKEIENLKDEDKLNNFGIILEKRYQ